MYKKIVLLLSLFLLVGCGQQAKETSTTTKETETTQEAKPVAKDIKGAPFQEKIPADSKYPVAQLDEGISISELKKAMETYYNENYTEEDININKKEIVPRELERLQKSFNEDDRFEGLNISVEPVTIEIAGDTLNVARVIVPKTYVEAEKKLKNNDIAILNETLSNIGDRLVLIGYYDENTKVLTPMHLTNSLKPLFYNQYLAEKY